MSARKKLNQGYLTVCGIMAAIVGLACQSWLVFWLASATFVGFCLHTGEIRPDRRRPTPSANTRRRPPRKSFRRRRP